ncbi:hypothetical protein ACTGJ9_037965 [Bradyrhizobium sp. RDM12]
MTRQSPHVREQAALSTCVIETGGLQIPSAHSVIDADGKLPVLEQAFGGRQPELTDQLRSTSIIALDLQPLGRKSWDELLAEGVDPGLLTTPACLNASQAA